MPEQYRAWLRVALGATIVGYGLVLLALLPEHGLTESYRLREPYVLGILLFAAWLMRRGQPRAAAFLVVATPWVEGHVTFLASGAHSVSAAIFPTLVFAAALFLSMPAARRMALSTFVTLPASVATGHWLRGEPLWQDADTIVTIVVVCSTGAAAAVLSLFLRAFGPAQLSLRLCSR